MQEEPATVRTARGATLLALAAEDLDLYGLAELGERAARLAAEIARTQAAMARKRGDRSAAEALFGPTSAAAGADAQTAA